jgi:ubiquinone/menaquinone biosynthesis C-methylase UbiE
MRFPLQIPDDLDSFRIPEYDAVRVALGDCRGLRVLDAGCGDGQFADLLKSASQVVGVDRCIKPLQGRRARSSSPAEVVRGDVMEMPFPADTFDAAICTSVLSQVPSADLRNAMLRDLLRVLRPGGRLIVTGMHYNYRFRRKAYPQEGWENGDFYRKFDMEEFRDAVAAHFEVTALWGLWNYLPKTHWLFTLLDSRVIPWERFIRTRKTSMKYCKFLLAICRKRS